VLFNVLLCYASQAVHTCVLWACLCPQVSQIKSTVHELLTLFKDNRLYMGGDCGDTAMVVLTPRSDIQGVTEVCRRALWPVRTHTRVGWHYA
jgi:hypothetical protein